MGKVFTVVAFCFKHLNILGKTSKVVACVIYLLLLGPSYGQCSLLQTHVRKEAVVWTRVYSHVETHITTHPFESCCAVLPGKLEDAVSCFIFKSIFMSANSARCLGCSASLEHSPVLLGMDGVLGGLFFLGHPSFPRCLQGRERCCISGCCC